MRPAVGYIRVSTPGQVTDGVSLAAQKSKIATYVQLHDFELLAVEADEGISGKSADNRPGLQKALKLACQHHAALIVYSLSRLARSTRDAINISERLEKSKADLVSVTENIDTTSAAGKMVFKMLAVLAEFERDTISERTRAAMGFKRQQGQRTSRRIPFGWDLAAGGVRLVENAAEQRTLRRIRALRKKGASLRRICAVLTKAGVKTKAGAAVWHPSVVRGILTRQQAIDRGAHV